MLKKVSFDADEISFVMDNSATARMCNDRNIFKNMTLHGENEGPSVATMGSKGYVKGAGDARISWEEDEGKKHMVIF